jgi:hypothetical protein
VWARKDKSAVTEAGTPVVGIVVCATWANQPLVGVVVCLFHMYVSLSKHADEYNPFFEYCDLILCLLVCTGVPSETRHSLLGAVSRAVFLVILLPAAAEFDRAAA